MKKRVFTVIFSAALAAALLAGCAQQTAYVTSISPATVTDTGTTYTITYSNGKTQQLTVNNGKNGENAPVTPEALYEKYVEIYGEISYEEFLNKYFSAASSTTAVVGKCLRSSMKVYTTFVESTSTVRPGIGGWSSVKYYNYNYKMGSAVVYSIMDEDAYIITNYHVIYDASADLEANGGNLAKEIYCYLYGSEAEPVKTGETDLQYGYNTYDFGSYAIACEIVGGSITSDIAILKARTSDLRAINSDVCAVEVTDSYYVGETAIAIGNPEGEGISVTRGIVSVDNENVALNIDGTARYYRSIRIDTSLYSGNSGGGLFNDKGELIGITNAGNTQDQNINYAVPIDIAKGTADNIIYYARDNDPSTNNAYKITVGITVAARDTKYIFETDKGHGVIREDVVIETVNEGSIAEKMGLQAGDFLFGLKINGKDYIIHRNFDISDLLLTVRAGDVIQFRYGRAADEAAQMSTEYTVLPSDLNPMP